MTSPVAIEMVVARKRIRTIGEVNWRRSERKTLDFMN